MKNVMCKQTGLVRELQEISMYKSILEQILENAYEGVVVTDATGKIIMLNNAYANYLGIDAQAAIGKHVTEVIDNTRVHTVVQSGVPEFGKLQRIGSHKAVVTRLPILFNQEIVAGVGIVHYRELQDMKELLDKLNSLESELAQIKEEYAGRRVAHYSIQDIIGESPQVLALKKQIRKAADSNSTVLILGENGTGKELVAHAIHYLSARSSKPFVRINCAAIPADILESELFGYVGGAFTGSNRGGKKGKIEMADSGTLFLDEIGDLPPEVQANLLRFLEEKKIHRLGGTKPIPANVRVVASTNTHLEQAVREGRFREDLYYRLNVLHLRTPSLRERKGDVELLARYFFTKFTAETKTSAKGFSRDALEVINRYDWPGNVRELMNRIRRAVMLSEGPHIIPSDMELERRSLGRGFVTLDEARMAADREAIQATLLRTRFNIARAAQELGVSRMTLYRLMEKYDIRRDNT